MLENIVNLKDRISDDSIDSEKEIKYLLKIEKVYSDSEKKIKKVLSHEPKYYYNSDDDTETEWEFEDCDEEFICDKSVLIEMIHNASSELKDIWTSTNIHIIKNTDFVKI